ncbi:hypothetical protein GUITHDRAFT_151124 [Guillardia theta CCMP2712]|uniref:Uncharacterized protein n=1 Tax=Guillardia theta (strain CCMP2712) TaxID=905079 RepID=L1JSC6_GUITC|nr:hypothetical protein GUITHDRAFT_151124 [Guillardia theta CCMP2712]EKX50983.1 hypothetical protein GUITHDRAFT_151124 [Guillardia theta CCMP2712]|eukprot:XP_005837963.1 hypothetical protein GUITHDRAFT_151124 [Guillardia theta CCMP2712]
MPTKSSSNSSNSNQPILKEPAPNSVSSAIERSARGMFWRLRRFWGHGWPVSVRTRAATWPDEQRGSE